MGNSINLKTMQLWLFLLFGFELFIFGSGLHFSLGWMTPRKVIFALFSGVALLNFLSIRSKSSINNSILIIMWMAFFLFWIFVLWLFEDRPFSYGLRDALPFIGVMIFYLSSQTMTDDKYWNLAKTCVAILIFMYAALHVVISIMGFYSADLALEFANYLKYFMEPENYVVESSVFIVPLVSGLVRVYFVGSCMLLLGLYLWPWVYRRNTLAGISYIAFIYLALLSTLTRSFLISTVIYLIGNSIFRFIFRRIKLSIPILLIAIAAPFFASQILLFTIDPVFLNSMGLGRDISDDLRYEQFKPLFDAFLNSPVVGHGFGLSVEPIRNEDGPYSYELSIVALFAKIGIFGLLLASYFLAVTIKISSKINKLTDDGIRLYSLYFAFVFGSFFNPYLFSFYGTFFLLFLLYDYSNLSRNRVLI